MKALNLNSNKQVKPYSTNNSFSVDAFKSISEKFSNIDTYIESGQEIPNELSKSFVSCSLSNDPFSEIE